MTWLDYSPNTAITPGTGVPPDPGFGDFFYEEERVSDAEELLSQADDIINITLPHKINKAYYFFLGGDNNDYDYIIRNVSKEDATNAKTLCIELLQDEANYSRYGTNMSAERAYDDFFEDMGAPGVAADAFDTDGDGFIGAIGLFQQVLNEPTEDGPFDPTPTQPCGMTDAQYASLVNQNTTNRNQLQSTINSLKSSEPGLNLFLRDQVEPRLRSARNSLNHAISHWNDRCGPLLRRYLCRYNYIIAAKVQLKEMIDFMGAVEGGVPSSNLAIQIQQTNALLQGDVTSAEATEALAQCNDMLADPEITTYPNLVDLITDARDNLNLAIANWGDVALRNYYLDMARQKMEILNDIVD
jgi:hypothetical protein